jgi:hypothetical protein
MWVLRALQHAVPICCLRVSIGNNTAIAPWTAEVLTHSGLVVAESSVEVDTVGAALHASACGKVREVKVWRVGAKWHTETRSRISEGAHRSRTGGNAEICAIVCPLRAAVEGIFNAGPEVSVTPCASSAHSDTDS